MAWQPPAGADQLQPSPWPQQQGHGDTPLLIGQHQVPLAALQNPTATEKPSQPTHLLCLSIASASYKALLIIRQVMRSEIVPLPPPAPAFHGAGSGSRGDAIFSFITHSSRTCTPSDYGTHTSSNKKQAHSIPNPQSAFFLFFFFF